MPPVPLCDAKALKEINALAKLFYPLAASSAKFEWDEVDKDKAVVCVVDLLWFYETRCVPVETYRFFTTDEVDNTLNTQVDDPTTDDAHHYLYVLNRYFSWMTDDEIYGHEVLRISKTTLRIIRASDFGKRLKGARLGKEVTAIESGSVEPETPASPHKEVDGSKVSFGVQASPLSMPVLKLSILPQF